MYSIEYPGEKRPFVLLAKRIKKILKESARHLLYWKNKKPYKVLVNEDVAELNPIIRKENKEFFYGYYDKSPECNGRILFHEMGNGYVNVIIKSLEDGVETIIGKSSAFNWQMGARALWVTNDIVSYNDFDGQQYISKWYSVNEKKIIRTIPIPTMDIVNDRCVLSPNFQRLRIVDPCYAYQNLPVPEETSLLDFSNDGIWAYDLVNNKLDLLISINDIISCKSETVHKEGYHGVNHIMVSPDGECFIFIHRCRCGCERYDRLMLYEFNNHQLSCLMDGKLQSHFCWIDNATVFGYGEQNSKVGFYKIDIKTKQSEICHTLTNVHPQDGHPTVHGEWIVVDSYPNFSRLQTLIAYNHKTNNVVRLGEFFHDMRHAVYTRCDLHPRFNKEGTTIYFDTLYSENRRLCSLKINL